MTPAQRETAELLRSLDRPAELIAVNAGIPVEIVRAWLRSGRWPKSTPKQQTLFDATGLSPRPETMKPATVGHSHGLHLFSRAADVRDQRQTSTTHSGTERPQL